MAEYTDNVFYVECECDLNRRRLAFGLPGGPLVEAEGVKLPRAVRPWAYLWSDADSVQIDARPISHDRNAKKTRTLNRREPATKNAPVPLRARSSSNLHLQTEMLPREIGGPELPIPSHAERGDYLPPYVDGLLKGVTVLEARAHLALVSPTKALRSARDALRAMSPGRRMQHESGKQAGGTPTKPVASAAANGSSSAHEPAASATASGEKMVGQAEGEGGEAERDEPDRRDGYDASSDGGFGSSKTPKRRAAPSTPGTAGSVGLSTGVSTGRLKDSIRSARTRTRSPLHSPRSPRGKGTTHMWDVVRYVSGVYGEVYKQI